MSTGYQLVIGTKAWSSWSLRPWLLMRYNEIAFSEVTIGLRAPDTAGAIARHSPSGKVPALIDGGLTIWDSLAIAEYLADRHRDVAIWPKDFKARAIARCVSAEMHSGFQALRQNCPMDFNVRGLEPIDPTAMGPDVTRIVTLIKSCRAEFGQGGPYLFSDFSAADAMYAPVISRFDSYGVDLSAHGDDGTVASYCGAMSALPAMRQWSDDAAREHRVSSPG
jgi:glutathione S-transferase